MTFYERFSELCEERGTTPNKVCTVVGLSGSSASVWKKRGSRPKDETLKDIANFLDTTPEYLLGFSDVKSKREEWEKRLQERKTIDEVIEEWANKNETANSGLYGEVCSMIMKLPEAKLQRVKDFVSGLME